MPYPAWRSLRGRSFLRPAALWTAAAAAAALWAALFRGGFLHFAALDGDEALFLMIGKGWAQGAPPYTAIWDLKPPGLYLIYAAVWKVFGDDLAGPKLASIAAVALTGLALYAFAEAHLKSRRCGLLALLLYAPSTLVLGGLASKPDLLMTPFLAWAAVAVMASARSRAPALAALAGLLAGCAGMVKQTAVFEAAYFFLVLATAERRPGPRALAFLAGCAVPPLLFAAWFARMGLLDLLWRGAVLSAFQRLGGDGVAFVDGPQRFIAMLKPVLPFAIGAGLLWCERRRLDGGLRPGVRFVAGWAIASATGVLIMRSMYEAYLQPLLPSLALLCAIFLALAPWPMFEGRTRRWLALVLAAASVLYPVAFLRASPQWRLLQTRLPQRIGAYLHGAALRAGDSIYVVDYEPAVYLLSGAAAPTRFVLPMHLICPFPATGVRPAAEIRRILRQEPRCLVLAASRRRMACEDTQLTQLAERLAGTRYSIRRRFADGEEAVDVVCRPQ